MSDSRTGITKRSKYANKRTPDEIEQHRVFIAEKVQQGFTYAEVRDMLEAETGYSLSTAQIGYDMRSVRKGWRDAQFETYQAYVNEELAWLDMMERKLWREYRKSAETVERKKIEEVMQKASEHKSPELAVAAITTYIEENPSGDSTILDKILKARQERRRILGLYAPSKALIRTEHVKSENIQGYEQVDPDDWPDKEDAVEGEFTEQAE